MSSISLNLEMLEEELVELGPDLESKQLVAAIRGEVERLSRTAEQYLAAVREPHLELEREDLGALVRECHAFVRIELERAGLDSEVEVDDDLPAVDVDEGQIRQALVNLVRNAREALDEGGTVRLLVSQHGDHVRVRVEDDGPGIPDDVRASIFDPFYTTKRHGTGLGLAVTRSIVEAHRGRIACRARPGGGTIFDIELPIPD